MSRHARRVVTVLGILTGLLLVTAAPALAQEEVATRESLNTVFFLVCTVLVFLMHPGFAILAAVMTTVLYPSSATGAGSAASSRRPASSISLFFGWVGFTAARTSRHGERAPRALLRALRIPGDRR